MILPPDIPWSQAFLEDQLCQEPLKTYTEHTETEEAYLPFPFQEDFYRPDDKL